MFIYPYKIFTVSKDKRTLDKNLKAAGIYDCVKMNYKEAEELAEKKNLKVSVLLGKVIGDINLICLDLDDCFNPDGTIEKLTKEFLEEFSLDEYEVSSSGEGVHVYILTKMQLDTFIVKEMKGCKSFECYTNKRHIVTTTFDFTQVDLRVGAHDEFLKKLYDKVNQDKKSTIREDVKMVFQGEEFKNDAELRGKLYGRTPVSDMYTLRGCGYKDPELIAIIDENPESVDQSAHDAKLIRKLMYYTLEDFDAAWEFAKKTNYYKSKDAFHKKKFDDVKYKERTRRFLSR